MTDSFAVLVYHRTAFAPSMHPRALGSRVRASEAAAHRHLKKVGLFVSGCLRASYLDRS